MIFEKVKVALAEELNVEPEKITPEADVVVDLGADSLDVVQLIMRLEDEFGMQIPDEDMASFKTVDSIVKYLEAKQK